MNAQGSEHGAMVPDERHPGYAFPTWREALIDAFEGVPAAYERRRRMAQAAYDAGLSLRSIAEVVGMTGPAIHKIVGRQRPEDVEAFLDSPAGMSPDA